MRHEEVALVIQSAAGAKERYVLGEISNGRVQRIRGSYVNLQGSKEMHPCFLWLELHNLRG